MMSIPKDFDTKWSVVSFADFEIIDYLSCDRCHTRANTYKYIPVLDMWVCERCYYGWPAWGYGVLKERIGYYDD